MKSMVLLLAISAGYADTNSDADSARDAGGA